MKLILKTKEVAQVCSDHMRKQFADLKLDAVRVQFLVTGDKELECHMESVEEPPTGT